jgi:hypothetical protein
MSCTKNDCFLGKKTYYRVAEETKPYFEMYQNGAWWVYENTTKTKRDSVYVTNYHTYNIERGCDRFENRQGRIISKYLFLLPDIDFEYSRSRRATGFLVGLNSLLGTDGQRERNGIGYNHDVLVFSSETSYNEPLEFVPQMVLNNQTYIDIIIEKMRYIKKKNIYYAKNTGICRLETETDTFNLVKYQLP